MCYQAILMQTKVISVKYCPTEDMLADIMTKGHTKITFQRFGHILKVSEINWHLDTFFVYTVWSLSGSVKDSIFKS